MLVQTFKCCHNAGLKTLAYEPLANKLLSFSYKFSHGKVYCSVCDNSLKELANAQCSQKRVFNKMPLCACVFAINLPYSAYISRSTSVRER